jgi:hypothetical protein
MQTTLPMKTPDAREERQTHCRRPGFGDDDWPPAALLSCDFALELLLTARERHEEPTIIRLWTVGLVRRLRRDPPPNGEGSLFL